MTLKSKKRPQKSSETVVKAVANDKGSNNFPNILQFACAEYYCMEGETHVEVKVERLGNPIGAAQVDYYTVDGSAYAGKKYIAARGIAQFEPQQTECIIRVELIADESFDSVLEFEIHLQNAVGGTLDKYLYKCEITVVDDDAFPTNKHKQEFEADDHRNINEGSLVLEYFRMHFQDKSFCRQAVKTFVTDQLENVKMIWNLLVIKYLIDTVLDTEAPKKPPFEFLYDVEVNIQVYAIVILLLLPHPLEWIERQAKANRRMGGMARMRLQENLMRKFLNYNEMSRAKVSNSDLTMAVTRDVPDLVADGLLMIFPILQKVTLVFMYGAFAIIQQPTTCIFFVAFPILMFAFLKRRVKVTEEEKEAIFHSQTQLVTLVHKVTEFFRTISDYGQKQETVTSFAVAVHDYNNKVNAHHKRQITNHAFAPFITSCIIGCYILMFYEDVRSPTGMGIGGFIAGVGVWRGIGACYQGIYEHILTLQDSLSCLHNVAHYMNLPTDVHIRAETKRSLLQELDKAQDASCALFCDGKTSECALVQNGTNIISGSIVESACYSQDLIQIHGQDVHFAYPARGETAARQIFVDTCFIIPQGHFVSVVGPSASGKTTLLELLAGIHMPSTGSGLLFVPPHLRLLHVTRDPIFFDGCTIRDNILYGEVSKEDGDPERLLRICQRLGMTDEVLAVLESQLSCEEVQRDTAQNQDGGKRSHIGSCHSVASRKAADMKACSMTQVSHTDRCLIHLARALIVNPDLLIIHKPLANLHEIDVERILEILREFVDLRGLETSLDLRRQRRPRTCIASMDSLDGIDMFDKVLEVRDCKVLEVDIAVVDVLEQQARELLSVLDKDGYNIVMRNVFIDEVSKRSDLAQLFEVSKDMLKNSPAESKRVLGEFFSTLDFGKKGQITTDELSRCFHHQLTAHLPVCASPEKGKINTQIKLDGDTIWDTQALLPDDAKGDVMTDTLAHRFKCNALKYPYRPGIDPRKTPSVVV